MLDEGNTTLIITRELNGFTLTRQSTSVMNVHAPMHIYTHNAYTHKYTHTHTQIHTHIHTQTHAHTQIQAHTHTYTHMHMHIHTYNLCNPSRIQTVSSILYNVQYKILEGENLTKLDELPEICQNFLVKSFPSTSSYSVYS